MSELEPEDSDVARAVSEALRVPLPESVAARHVAALRAALEHTQGATRAPARSATVLPMRRPRRLRHVVVLALAAAVGVSMLSGAAFAADRAVPGDVLYGLDRLVERAQLATAGQGPPRARVRLRQAMERLRELEELERRGDHARAVVAALQAADATDEAIREGGEAVAAAARTNIEALTRVLDRLTADGKANEAALAALGRAIERAESRSHTSGGPAGSVPSGQDGGTGPSQGGPGSGGSGSGGSGSSSGGGRPDGAGAPSEERPEHTPRGQGAGDHPTGGSARGGPSGG